MSCPMHIRDYSDTCQRCGEDLDRAVNEFSIKEAISLLENVGYKFTKEEK